MAGTWIISGDMQISDILSPAAVRTMTQSTSKKRLFQEIAEQARAIYGVDATHTLDALQERESLGPTGVGHGVALPHARLHGLDRVVGLFADALVHHGVLGLGSKESLRSTSSGQAFADLVREQRLYRKR